LNIAVGRRIIVIRPVGSRTKDDVGAVQLVGGAGVPNVEEFRGPVGDTLAAGQDLSRKLSLPLERTAAPGENILDMNLGS
jgi:hypothetical protein